MLPNVLYMTILYMINNLGKSVPGKTHSIFPDNLLRFLYFNAKDNAIKYMFFFCLGCPED